VDDADEEKDDEPCAGGEEGQHQMHEPADLFVIPVVDGFETAPFALAQLLFDCFGHDLSFTDLKS
jgi:hypothetical protein